MSIRNPISDEIREKIVIDPMEFVEQEQGSREPPHHFSISWEGEKKKSVMTILSPDELKTKLKKKKVKGKDNPYMPRAVTEEDSNEFVPVLALESRGIEPYQFHAMEGEFVITSEGGMTFEGEDVDLSEGDWAEYDADNDISLSITDLQTKFEAV